MIPVSRLRSLAAVVVLSLGAIAALVYAFELGARGLGIAEGRVRWEIPIGGAGLLGAGWLLWRGAELGRNRLRVSASVGGAAAALVSASGAMSGSGLGRLQWEVIVAGVVMPVLSWLATRSAIVKAGRRLSIAAAVLARTRIAVWAGLGTVLAASAFAWAVLLGTPLGHDEAVYALKARAWMEGTPDTGFGVYRSIGMPLVAWGLQQVSDSETVLRLLGLAGILGLAGMTWVFGRRLYGAAAGLVAAGSLVGVSSLLRRVPEFLNDISAAALLLAVAYLLWRHLGAQAGDRRVLLIAPIGLATFYLRYGSLVSFAVVAAAAVLIWPRRVWQSRGLLLIAAAAFAAGLIPHGLYSVSETGSVTGVLEAAGRVAGREYVGEGLVDYVAWSRSQLAGPLAAVIGAAGIASAVVAIARRKDDRISRGSMFLVSAGLLQIVVLGLLSHAEERYVFMALAMLLIVGSGAVVGIVRRMPATVRPYAAIALVLAMAVTYADSLRRVDRQLEGVGSSRDVYVDVGEATAVSPGAECVVLSSFVPEVTWYSGCATYRHDSRFGLQAVVEADAGFIVLFDVRRDDNLRVHVEDLIAAASEPVLVRSAGTSIGDARIWKVPPADAP